MGGPQSYKYILDRVMCNIHVWAKHYMLYKMGILWDVLLCTQLAIGPASIAFQIVLHTGFLHRRIAHFPLRRPPYGFEELLSALFGEYVYCTCKWHDLHHSVLQRPSPTFLQYMYGKDKSEKLMEEWCKLGCMKDENGNPVVGAY